MKKEMMKKVKKKMKREMKKKMKEKVEATKKDPTAKLRSEVPAQIFRYVSVKMNLKVWIKIKSFSNNIFLWFLSFKA